MKKQSKGKNNVHKNVKKYKNQNVSDEETMEGVIEQKDENITLKNEKELHTKKTKVKKMKKIKSENMEGVVNVDDKISLKDETNKNEEELNVEEEPTKNMHSKKQNVHQVVMHIKDTVPNYKHTLLQVLENCLDVKQPKMMMLNFCSKEIALNALEKLEEKEFNNKKLKITTLFKLEEDVDTTEEGPLIRYCDFLYSTPQRREQVRKKFKAESIAQLCKSTTYLEFHKLTFKNESDARKAEKIDFELDWERPIRCVTEMPIKYKRILENVEMCPSMLGSLKRFRESDEDAQPMKFQKFEF